MSKSRECYPSLSRMLPNSSALSVESMVTVRRSYWATLPYFTQERGMLSTVSKTAVAATTALIISLAPIATADLAFAHGGGGGGSRGGGGHFGGGGGHFDGGGGHVAGGHFAGGRFAGGAFPERGFHRHFGLFGGLFGDCVPYNYPYPYGYNYCY